MEHIEKLDLKIDWASRRVNEDREKINELCDAVNSLLSQRGEGGGNLSPQGHTHNCNFSRGWR